MTDLEEAPKPLKGRSEILTRYVHVCRHWQVMCLPPSTKNGRHKICFPMSRDSFSLKCLKRSHILSLFQPGKGERERYFKLRT